MARPSEICKWCKNLIENDVDARCVAGKNPFRWVITCEAYRPKY